MEEPDVPVRHRQPRRFRREDHQLDGSLHVQAADFQKRHRTGRSASVGTSHHAQSYCRSPSTVAVRQRQYQGRFGGAQRFRLHPWRPDELGAGMDEFGKCERPNRWNHPRCGLEHVRLVLRSRPQYAETCAVPAQGHEQRASPVHGRCRADRVLQPPGKLPRLLLDTVTETT